MKVLGKFFCLSRKSNIISFEELEDFQFFKNFSGVVYPDSAPENWMDIVSDMHVPCFISPLHDHDIGLENELIKPHYHVMFMFECEKSLYEFKEFFSSFGGVGCNIVFSVRGYAEYMCNLGAPDKYYQYNPADVKSFAGADYFSVCGLTSDV